jgi:hypothetical protein
MREGVVQSYQRFSCTNIISQENITKKVQIHNISSKVENQLNLKI